MFDAGGETIVVITADRIDPSNRTECGYRAALLNSERPAGGVRVGLVVIAEDGQIQAMVSVVGQLNKRVLGKFALYGQEPILDIRPRAVCGYVVDVRIDGIESCRVADARRKAVLRRQKSRRGWIGLVDDAKKC